MYAPAGKSETTCGFCQLPSPRGHRKLLRRSTEISCGEKTIGKEETVQYQLIRSNRKSMSIEIRDGKVIVRAPFYARREDVDRLLWDKRDWIAKHLALNQRRKEAVAGIQPLTDEELQRLACQAANYLPDRVRHYAALLGVRPGRITIRAQRTRWGSCSSKGNLNFNCLLMLTPPEVIDSVVVHELCHLKEMNHSEAFYREVYRIYPNYEKYHAWLKQHQAELMARLG